MRKILLLLIPTLLFSYGRFSKYYGIVVNTTTEKAEMRLRGDIMVGTSTSNIKGIIYSTGSFTGVSIHVSTVTATHITGTNYESRFNQIATDTTTLKSDMDSRFNQVAIDTTTLKSDMDSRFSQVGTDTTTLRNDLTAETNARISKDNQIAIATTTLNDVKLDKSSATVTYLYKNEKASDSDKLDGFDFTHFISTYGLQKTRATYDFQNQGAIRNLYELTMGGFGVGINMNGTDLVDAILDNPTIAFTSKLNMNNRYIENVSTITFSDGTSMSSTSTLGGVRYNIQVIQLRESEGSGSDTTTSSTWENKLTREGGWYSWIDYNKIHSAVAWTYAKIYSTATECYVQARVRVKVNGTYYYGDEVNTDATTWAIFTDSITIPASEFNFGLTPGNLLVELQTKSDGGYTIYYSLGRCHLVVKTEE